jgi:hypothetical protein
LGPEADPEDAERPACRTREERNPLGTWGRSGGCREAGMQDKRGEESSWDLRPIRRMQRGRHAGHERRGILLGPEADPEDAERPAACRTREERNPLGIWGRSGGCREAGMQDKRGEKSSWDLRPIQRMQRGRHAGKDRREIPLGPGVRYWGGQAELVIISLYTTPWRKTTREENNGYVIFKLNIHGESGR